MVDIAQILISNVVVAAGLAVVAWAAGRFVRNPHLTHALWLLVLLKLVMPPLAFVDLSIARRRDSSPAPVAPAVQVPQGDSPSRQADWSPVSPAADLASAVASGTLADEAWTPAAPSPFMDDAYVEFVEPSFVEFEPTYHAIVDENRITPGAVATTAAEPVSSFAWGFVSRRRWELLFAVWLAGSGSYIVLAVLDCLRFRRVLRAPSVELPGVEATVARLARTLGLRRPPRVRVIYAKAPPLVWSFGGRPQILLPAQLMRQLDASQREAVLAHELAHVKRRDHLVRWLEAFVLAVWWWNPLAWYARRRLREAEEACCDAWVVWALPTQRRSYGRAMLATNEFLTAATAPPGLAGCAFAGSYCKRRIEMVMKRNVPRRMSRPALAVVALLAAAALPVAAQNSADQGVSDQNAASALAAPSSGSLSLGGGAQSVVATDDGRLTATLQSSSDDAAGAPAPRSSTLTFDDGVVVVSTPEAELRASSLTLGVGGNSDLVADDDTAAAQSSLGSADLGARVAELERLVRRLLEAQQPGLAPARAGTSFPSTTAIPRPAAVPAPQTAGQSPNGLPASRFGALPPAPTAPPVSSGERDLQERLLEIEVRAAEMNLKRTQNELLRRTEINERSPGVIHQREIEQYQYQVEIAEIEVERAAVKLKLFQAQSARAASGDFETRATGILPSSTSAPAQQRASESVPPAGRASTNANEDLGGAIQAN